MTTPTIDIEGLPEGWEVKSIDIRPASPIDTAEERTATVHLQKTKPRRIVLEETGEDNRKDSHTGAFLAQYFGDFMICHQPKIWRIKEE